MEKEKEFRAFLTLYKRELMRQTQANLPLFKREFLFMVHHNHNNCYAVTFSFIIFKRKRVRERCFPVLITQYYAVPTHCLSFFFAIPCVSRFISTLQFFVINLYLRVFILVCSSFEWNFSWKFAFQEDFFVSLKNLLKIN